MKYLFIFVLLTFVNSEKFILEDNKNFTNEILIYIPQWDYHFDFILDNISYNVSVQNNFDDVFSVTIPLIDWSYPCRFNCSNTINNIDINSRWIKVIEFTSSGYSHINYSIILDYINKTKDYPHHYSVDNNFPSLLLLIYIIIGSLLVFFLACIMISFFVKKIRDLNKIKYTKF